MNLCLPVDEATVQKEDRNSLCDNASASVTTGIDDRGASDTNDNTGDDAAVAAGNCNKFSYEIFATNASNWIMPYSDNGVVNKLSNNLISSVHSTDNCQV